MNPTLYKALILDDEHFLADILSKALQKEGISSCAVTDVDSAIQQLDKNKFDIVVSDIYLPDKSGEDLFNHAQTHQPDIPFIFITGNPNVETAVNFLKQGAYDYLQKPFMLPEFVRKVKHVISESHKRQKEKNLVIDLKQILTKHSEDLRIFQDIFESKKDGLLILDMEGVIVRINPGFIKMTGLNETEVVTKPLSCLCSKIFPGINFETIQRTITQNGQWKSELKANRKSGDSWVANFSFFPVQNEAGRTFAYSAIISDVSSLRKVEGALIEAQEAIIFGMARLAEYRDRETGFHLERIRSYSKELALEMRNHYRYKHQIDNNFVKNLYRTAPLHDIGKVGIPDHILLKEGRLTPDEYEIIKSHTIIGYQTLNSIRKQYGEMDFLNMGIEITYSHHERFDGLGYPQRLKGDEIPLSAQIVSITDMYDALTSQRVYKEAFSHLESINIMKTERGKRFDPVLFDIFLKISDKFDKIRQDFLAREEPPASMTLFNWSEKETA